MNLSAAAVMPVHLRGFHVASLFILVQGSLNPTAESGPRSIMLPLTEVIANLHQKQLKRSSSLLQKGLT